jgi:hypothetical protein
MFKVLCFDYRTIQEDVQEDVGTARSGAIYEAFSKTCPIPCLCDCLSLFSASCLVETAEASLHSWLTLELVRLRRALESYGFVQLDQRSPPARYMLLPQALCFVFEKSVLAQGEAGKQPPLL